MPLLNVRIETKANGKIYVYSLYTKAYVGDSYPSYQEAEKAAIEHVRRMSK